MRHIKPQVALVAAAHTQIGSRPMLAISIGVGFRLSDPSILVHEAAVWEALKAAAPSTLLHEAALPKWRAEWLLAGHSTHCVAAGVRSRFVDWPAWAELDGVRKSVSCQARVASSTMGAADANDAAAVSSAREVSLTIDHRHASAGPTRDNPVGVTAGSAPLQSVRAFGVGPAALAAMGAIDSDWPERRQWMPARPGSVQALADDGTHMGWPAHVDLRFFQQAAPDQWSSASQWTPGARFELNSFGPRGAGYAGHLPRLAPVALVTRALDAENDSSNDAATSAPPERLPLEQQTVWFLPDGDIGVIWWNGAVTLDHVLDDSVATLVVAFKDERERIDVDALMSFAGWRADLTRTEPTQQADHPLMPAIAHGWTWEMILDADDHPRFAPATRSAAESRARLEDNRQSLIDAHAAQVRLQAFEQANRSTALPATPRGDDEDWRRRLCEADTPTLSGVTIRDADLSTLRFDGWTFDGVRFERCRFDRSEWSNCRFDDVHVVDSSLTNMTMRDAKWDGGALCRSDLEGSAWLNVELERLSLEDCRLDALKVAGGSWSMLSVQGRGGAGGDVRDVAWDSVSWTDVDAPDWHWTRLHADNLAIAACRMTGLQVTQCTLLKPGILSTDLAASLWSRNTFTFAVLSHGSSIDGARLTDCLFRASSFQHLRADRAQIDHCAFVQFNAQHLRAAQSRWTDSVLDGANLMHAHVAGAAFERCSLKDAMLYGADLRLTRMRDCNLIDARTAWVHRPEAGAWRANLTAGQLDDPRRGA